MIYDYIIENYELDEPIFISALPGNSREYIRQEMKRLVDQGKLERVYNGVYHIAYTTILGTRGRVSVEKYVEKRFLSANGETIGYITGIMLANQFGFTTQNPSCIEVCSNEATTKQRKIDFEGRKIIIYNPVAKITKKNKTALQFLDFMSTIEKYSELSGQKYKDKLKELTKTMNVDFNQVKEYIDLFPDRVYRNIYQGGLMNELV